MPVYEYECTQCNERCEVMQKITDDPLRTCSSCGGNLRKLITSTSFVLKGNGWYVSDYPSSDRKKAMESEKPGGTDKSKKSEAKTETKSDTKKETVKS